MFDDVIKELQRRIIIGVIAPMLKLNTEIVYQDAENKTKEEIDDATGQLDSLKNNLSFSIKGNFFQQIDDIMSQTKIS